MKNEAEAALAQVAHAKYEAIEERRNRALSRMTWCSACRDWVSTDQVALHNQQNEAHHAKYDARRIG